MLGGPDALEPPVDHDAHAGAERLALLHGVGGEHNGLAAADHLEDAVPQEAARAGVHARRRLVLQGRKKDMFSKRYFRGVDISQGIEDVIGFFRLWVLAALQ